MKVVCYRFMKPGDYFIGLDENWMGDPSKNPPPGFVYRYLGDNHPQKRDNQRYQVECIFPHAYEYGPQHNGGLLVLTEEETINVILTRMKYDGLTSQYPERYEQFDWNQIYGTLSASGQ